MEDNTVEVRRPIRTKSSSQEMMARPVLIRKRSGISAPRRRIQHGQKLMEVGEVLMESVERASEEARPRHLRRLMDRAPHCVDPARARLMGVRARRTTVDQRSEGLRFMIGAVTVAAPWTVDRLRMGHAQLLMDKKDLLTVRTFMAAAARRLLTVTVAMAVAKVALQCRRHPAHGTRTDLIPT